MEITWRCTVCGYLHKGDQPPATCPVCHVDASKFELVEEQAAEPTENVTLLAKLTAQVKGFIEEMKSAFVPHAVSAHFPNALLPTAALFWLLYFVSNKASFESTLFYLLVIVMLTSPITFATGFLDWRKKYSGKLTPIFRKKIALGIALVVIGLVAVLWRMINPEVLSSGGFSACAFSILLFIMLGCVTLLGHYGGMLVFSKRKE